MTRALVDLLFGGRQQIEQQSGEAATLQFLGDESVAGRMAAAPAPMRKEYDSLRAIGNREISPEGDSLSADLHCSDLNRALHDGERPQNTC
jgi:hypothetical protein